MNYQHLTREQRYQIAALRKAEYSCRQIARLTQCHPSTVARELKRNRDEAGYHATHAHRQAMQRRHAASARPRIDVRTWAVVEARLREEWSPQQIVGRGVAAVSHERIYQYIAQDKRCGGELWKHRRRRRHRRRRIGTPRQRQRFGGRRISERSPAIEQRTRIGHWEADSVLGTGPVRVISLIERKSLYLRLRRAIGGKAQTVASGIIAALYPVRQCVQSLTYDNGSEFAEHELIDIALDAIAYFADPHSPWQRATNENANGLLRQYLPKGRSMATLTDAQLQEIEDKLNNRPRKKLGFKTPSEVFFASFKRRTS